MLKTLGRMLEPYLMIAMMAFVGRTTRKRRINWHILEVLERQEKPYLLAVWHNNLIYLIYILGPRGVAGMISKSRDGNRIARVARFFGLKPVRGSSSSGALQAMRESVRVVKRGGVLAITPDGPRGPRYVVQAGMIGIARMARAPIVPICFSASDPWEFGSWDRMKLPKPFSTVTIHVGTPLSVSPEEDPEQARLRIEQAMRLHVAQTDRFVGGKLWEREPLLAEVLGETSGEPAPF